MDSYAGSTPTTRLRPNPKHFLTWSATVANNRIQKLGKNFVNNVSRLHSKMERVMPTFHPPPPTSTTSHNCSGSDQVENDLSEPSKSGQQNNHETFRISRVHKIPLQSQRNNCEKNECKTGSYMSNGGEGLNCSSAATDEEDANEERYSGLTPPTLCYRAQGKEIVSGDNNTSSASCALVVTASSLVYAGGNGLVTPSSSYLTSGGAVELSKGIATRTGPGFPHQIQVQSARIVQSHPFKQDVSTSSSSALTPKSLVQSGHYKIPPNPAITAEALKAMIINSPTELNSCRKFDDKPQQPIKCVDVEVETTRTNSDVKNMLELRTLHHHQVENQSKYNLSCGSSRTSNSNNASMSDSSNSSVRLNAPTSISSPQW